MFSLLSVYVEYVTNPTNSKVGGIFRSGVKNDTGPYITRAIILFICEVAVIYYPPGFCAKVSVK